MTTASLQKAEVGQSVAEARYPGIASTVDGSGAVVWVDSHIAQGACAYPITPSTPMGDGFAVEFANGKKNLWGEPLQFLEPESEHSSASACEGFALASGRVSNFTSGQGLILMKEVLYVIAGKRLPAVFHIGARALTSHSLNVHCGHDDVMGVADVGWGILFGRNAQEAADLALIARRAAEDTETPFLNVQDGFLTTHTLETIRLPEPEFMKEFVGAPHERIRKLFDTQAPLLSGPVQNQDSYMKGKVAQRHFYDRVAPALKRAFRDFSDATGRHYDSVLPYRMEDAAYAIIGMGSMMETAESTVDFLRKRGMRVGCITLVSFRPFPALELALLLRNCRAATVIERADVPLMDSNPLTTEVKAALADAHMGNGKGQFERLPEIYSGVAGLGGRDVRPGHFVAAAENMASHDRHRRFFVLGVKHENELPVTEDPDVRPAGAFSLRGHSIGGFGSVTTNKVIASVAADLFGLYAQAFPKYGSEKKGLPTNYYLTLAPKFVKLHCELKVVDFVAVQDAYAFMSGNPLEGLADGGLVYLQSNLPAEKIWGNLPEGARQEIRARKLRVYALDAGKIARESSSRADLQIRMQGIVLLGAFLRLTPFREQAGLDTEHLFGSLEKTLTKYFGKRGARVVADNMAAARRGYNEVVEILPPRDEETHIRPIKEHKFEPVSHPPNGHGLIEPNFCDKVIGTYARGREADLEADEYVARSLMPPSSAMRRSFRTLAPDIPELIAANCVGCMECVNACPDTAILAKAVEPAVLEEKLAHIERTDLREPLRNDFIKTSKYFEIPQKKGQAGGLFSIFVDPDKCKGCGECVTACGRHEALKMVVKDGNMAKYDLAMDLYHHLPETPAHLLNEKALGDMMLAGRSLLYAGGGGSCMGCGEATPIRLMLAATGFVYGNEIGIVAATGCNSVFGSTYPFNPYAVPWTNSLFENAPADALGIRLRWDQEGHHNRRLWVLGGDGAMYDIGFQSLSRLLMSGMDIKVLVLDTQVYSNTGGQTSTSTLTGQDAKMAAFGKAQPGKREHRKELGEIAMMHPGVFVAQTTAAHLNHFYKTIMEANAYPGPAVVIAYATCQPEHGVPDDRSLEQAKLAVESRTFPLFVYDPRKGERIRECLSLAGNPAMKQDWYVDPHDNQPVDFVRFARTEGRFARHFNDQGEADEFLKKATEDRLANWHRLQELAGLR
ncbi:MAG TPA: 2-oxoacid:acceptor oxidoreductase family protein [Terriglobales bacterium]|nr:2-oxoacid:acceptor oxidoreductase family protein [Terriglobales bacterium]